MMGKKAISCKAQKSDLQRKRIRHHKRGRADVGWFGTELSKDRMDGTEKAAFFPHERFFYIGEEAKQSNVSYVRNLLSGKRENLDDGLPGVLWVNRTDGAKQEALLRFCVFVCPNPTDRSFLCVFCVHRPNPRRIHGESKESNAAGLRRRNWCISADKK